MKNIWKILFLSIYIFSAADHAAGAVELQNQMAVETSPYLRLHANDLVAWQPWQESSLKAAQKSGKPIFLSIGYLACHWCHVMRRESFADPEIAGLINQRFYPILVDREEQPQVDALYQSALATMGLPIGWPLTVFLTPDRKPFWGGAYYPKKTTFGSPGLDTVLGRILDIYARRKKEILADAKQVIDELERESENLPGTISIKHIDNFAAKLLTEIDPFDGGFEGAPKFPNVIALETLWRTYIRTGRKVYGQAVEKAVRQMVLGGLYDHVGGGFFRYTIDRQWRTPHFEKMLGTNARLLRLMTEVWREFRNPILRDRILQTVQFLLREMLIPNRGFGSSIDADSETEGGKEEEGAYYVWHQNQLKEVLGDQYKLFVAAFEIAPKEGAALDTAMEAGILFRNENTNEELADEFKLTPTKVAAVLRAELQKLAEHRKQRVPPREDGKIISDLNGALISAVIKAGLALGQKDWIAVARSVFDRLYQSHFDPAGMLRRSVVDGHLGKPATLSDYAQLSNAALRLYETSGKTGYLNKAKLIAKQAISLMWDNKNHGFFSNNRQQTQYLLVRMKTIVDSDARSANSMMLRVLAQLYYLTGEEKWRQIASEMMTAFGGISKSPYFGHAGFLNAAEDFLAALQIVIIGDRLVKLNNHLEHEVAMVSIPTRVFQIVKPGTQLPDSHPAQFKEQVDGKPTAYVCRGQICSLPATTTKDLHRTLMNFRKYR